MNFKKEKAYVKRMQYEAIIWSYRRTGLLSSMYKKYEKIDNNKSRNELLK